MATTKYIDALRIFNGEYTMYHNSEKLKTVLRDDEIVRGCEIDYSDQFFTLKSLEDGNAITFTKGQDAPNNTIYYAVNKSSWQYTDTTITWNLDRDDTIKIYSNSDGFGVAGSYNGWRFSSTKKFKAYGNIMSLVYSFNFKGKTSLASKGDATFDGLFYGCSNLVDVSNLVLPATTLKYHCYGSMFALCTSITKAPKLPATTLAQYCYAAMFFRCYSLTKTPNLPATSIPFGAYDSMFVDCTSLVNAPYIAGTNLNQYSYRRMFLGCTSLSNVQDTLPATSLGNLCYWEMFGGCTSLVTAPALPATTVKYGCYEQMFDGCTSLTNIPSLQATTLASYCYRAMFYGCTSLVNAPSIQATTLAEHCCEEMFYGCTSLTTSPALNATTLVSGCYNTMFYGCTSLNKVTCYATNVANTDYYTSSWLANVASSGNFYAARGATWQSGSSGIPSGWTVWRPAN